jgi:hypothetical protein
MTWERCSEPVIEIDYYGERLVGCIECNCWHGGKSAFLSIYPQRIFRRSAMVAKRVQFNDETWQAIDQHRARLLEHVRRLPVDGEVAITFV